jgi:hypothetical protein
VMILLSACGGSAQAETMTFKCTETVGGNQSEFTMVYEGTDEGILSVKTASGEMALPASKETREGKNDAGETYTVTGIKAFGETMAVMPDKGAIEECVKGKAPPEQLADADIVFSLALSCASSVPLRTEPCEDHRQCRDRAARAAVGRSVHHEDLR